MTNKATAIPKSNINSMFSLNLFSKQMFSFFWHVSSKEQGENYCFVLIWKNFMKLRGILYEKLENSELFESI